MTKEIETALRSAAEPGFWGQVQIDYQDGIAVVVRKTETIKIRSREDEDNRRNAYRR